MDLVTARHEERIFHARRHTRRPEGVHRVSSNEIASSVRIRSEYEVEFARPFCRSELRSRVSSDLAPKLTAHPEPVTVLHRIPKEPYSLAGRSRWTRG
jgi:hypothetical protein